MLCIGVAAAAVAFKLTSLTLFPSFVSLGVKQAAMETKAAEVPDKLIRVEGASTAGGGRMKHT